MQRNITHQMGKAASPFAARFTCCLLLSPLCFSLSASSLCAQQTNVNSPLTRSSHGFSEYTGVQWAVRGPGWFAQFGGPPPASAPRGGARFGTRFGSGDTTGFLNFYAGQSAQSGLSSGSSNLTLSNGQPGGLFVGRQVPFVLGVVPVVGDYRGGEPSVVPYAPRSALQDRLQRLRAEGVDLNSLGNTPAENGLPSTASPPADPVPVANVPQGSPIPQGSVEAIAAQRSAVEAAETAQTTAEMETYLARAEQAISAGKHGAARVYLKMALRRAPAERKGEITARLQSLD